MLLGASPLRLSFAGGGTDLKEYYEDFEGSVVSTAINHQHGIAKCLKSSTRNLNLIVQIRE